MTFSLIQHSTFMDFGPTPIGPAFIPSGPHTDFLHGNLIFIGCNATYQVVDFGWTPEKQATGGIGKSVRFSLVIGCNPPYSFIDFGPVPQGAFVPPVTRILDTHDGIKKKKKKKKQVDLIAEEVERREKLRKQIEEVIHPTVIEVVPIEEKEEEVAHSVVPVELKSLTPPEDYAGLARQQIVAKIQDDAQRELQRQLELKRLEDEEEERELMMILDAIL